MIPVARRFPAEPAEQPPVPKRPRPQSMQVQTYVGGFDLLVSQAPPNACDPRP